MILYFRYGDAPRHTVDVCQANTRGRRIIVQGSVASIINSTREINMGNSRKKFAWIGSTVCFDRGARSWKSQLCIPYTRESLKLTLLELIGFAQYCYACYAK